jgi:hypothetical protein
MIQGPPSVWREIALGNCAVPTMDLCSKESDTWLRHVCVTIAFDMMIFRSTVGLEHRRTVMERKFLPLFVHNLYCCIVILGCCLSLAAPSLAVPPRPVQALWHYLLLAGCRC